jgi:hypothetical protein
MENYFQAEAYNLDKVLDEFEQNEGEDLHWKSTWVYDMETVRTRVWNSFLKKNEEFGKMAEQLRALAALREDSGSIPSTPVVPHICL